METKTLIKEIIKCCYTVHKELGPGFSEKIYERSLSIVFDEQDIRANSQHPILVYFHDQLVGEFFADFHVENVILVELKAVTALDSSHKSQVLNYLKATKSKVGLLVNFGAQKLEISRLYNNQAEPT